MCVRELGFGMLIFVLLLGSRACAQLSGHEVEVPSEATASPQIDPFVLLIRDNAVRDELKLTEPQRMSIDQLLREHNPLLLAIRDVGPQGAPDTAQPALDRIRRSLNELLDDSQQARFDGLILQAQGYDGLLRDDMVTVLGLSEDQQRQLRAVLEQYQARVRQLSETRPPDPDPQHQTMYDEAGAERHREILAVLDADQQRELARRLGASFDFSVLRSGPAWAPQFVGVESWINSPALTMDSLRGRVVVVHFFAFGCSNCINNYPWYREWQDAWSDRDMTIVGIHTPETEIEADVERLRESLRDHDLKFAVAVDNEKQNWQAWSNFLWPSVYLIDKRGCVRYWWYGELDWQGAGGQRIARQRIEELLAENPPE